MGSLSCEKCWKIGFVGVGVMGGAIAEGICNTRKSLVNLSFPLYLSHRGAEKVSYLSKKYGEEFIHRCESNAEVIEKSDILMFGLRVDQFKKISSEEFGCDMARHNHKDFIIINLMSTVSERDLKEKLNLDKCEKYSNIHYCKVIPIPAVAHCQGTTILHLPGAMFDNHIGDIVRGIFEKLGAIVAVRTEAELKPLLAVTSSMGPLFQTMATTCDWLEKQAVEKDVARRYVASFFHSTCCEAKSHICHVKNVDIPPNFQQLVDNQTKGGLNEYAVLAQHDNYQRQKQVLDAVLKRFEQEDEK